MYLLAPVKPNVLVDDGEVEGCPEARVASGYFPVSKVVANSR